jgi:hypothetical protein
MPVRSRSAAPRVVPVQGSVPSGAALAEQPDRAVTRDLHHAEVASLGGRSKEFQCDVVRVTAGQCRAVIGIDDATVGDSELFEPDLPSLQIISPSTCERQVVQTNATFIKWKGVRGIGKLVESDEGLTSDKPDGSSEWSGAFVHEHLHVEEAFVPPDTAVEITHRQRDMGDRRELKHGSLLVEPMISVAGSHDTAVAFQSSQIGQT